MSPSLPHLLNQEPPRPQQLIFPDLFVTPHFKHTESIVVTTDAVCGHACVRDMNSNTLSHSQSDGARLTVTGLRALEPAVLDVSVISTSTVIEPSTARSATTGSAGFLERAALWAHARTRDR